MRMRLIFLPLCTMASLICCELAAQHSAVDFKPLHQLAGTWKVKASSGEVFEEWHIQNDSTMISKNYALRLRDTVILERVSLMFRNGVIQYVSTVSNQNDQQPITFSLISADSGKYVFENLQHDFPSRIIYKLPKKASFHAWIEGRINGKERRSDYHFVQVVQ